MLKADACDMSPLDTLKLHDLILYSLVIGTVPPACSIQACSALPLPSSSLASVRSASQRAAVSNYCGKAGNLAEGSIYWIGLWDPVHAAPGGGEAT